MKNWFQSFSEKAEQFIQEKKSLFSSFKKKKEAPVVKSTKTAWLWVATVFCAISALVAIPSVSVLFWLALVALILPIEKWQERVKSQITQKFKIILIVALAIFALATFPSTETSPQVDDSFIPPATESDVIGVSDAELSDDDAILPTEESVEEVPEEPEHIHAFSDATCTSPKTCECGATEGESLGHSWSEATCIAPQTCSICGETTGSTIAHAYSYGSCDYCGADDPNYVYEETVWISGGKRYHSNPSCSGMKNPQEVSISTAEARGKTPCQKCY